MKAHRILIHSTDYGQVGDLIQVGRGIARWHDAQIDAQVSERDGWATLRNRVVRARVNDVLVTDLPDDRALRGRLVELLLHHGQRAILLPRRHREAWSLGAWMPAAYAGPGTNSEAATLVIIIGQHLRASHTGARPDETGLRSIQMIEGIFNGGTSAGLDDRSVSNGGTFTQSVQIRTISAETADVDGEIASERPDTGWIVIPPRIPGRLADAWDAGEVTVWRRSGPPPHRHPASGGFARAIQAFVYNAGQGWTVAGSERIRSADLAIRISGCSLIDPGLHQRWETLRERLAMPSLRADLLAAVDEARLRSILLLEDGSLAQADVASCLALPREEGS